MTIKNFFLKYKLYFIVFFLYTIITYIMVYFPVRIDIFKTYFGHIEPVMWSNYFWWFDYAVISLHINPLFDPYLYYPMGLDMIEGGLLPMFLFIPLTHIIGSVASYNIYLLLTFILSGFGMFLLVDYLINDKKIAFISGLIFSFCPFHFGASFGHLHTFSFMLLPFFALYVHKMVDSPSIRNVIICSIFFACTALTSWTVGVMASLFFAVYLIINFHIIKKLNYLLNLLLFTIISLILISPGLYYILKNIAINKALSFSLDNFINGSADLLAFLIPSPINPFFSSFTGPIYRNFEGGNFSESLVFIGYTVLVLSFVGLLYCRGAKKILPYIVTLIISFLFALGPILHINGSTFSNFYLPGILPTFVPAFNMIRIPSRYDILIMFCLSVIAAYGIKYLFERYKLKPSHRVVSCLLIGSLILFEFLAVIPTGDVAKVPSFYYTLSADDENYTIMDIPAQQSSLQQRILIIYYDEYQKIHRKPVIGGYIVKNYPLYEETVVQKDPVLLYLYYLDKSPQYAEIDPLEYLHQKFGIRYLIIHPKFIDNKDLNKLLVYLGNNFSLDNSVEDDPLIIYRCDITKPDTRDLGITGTRNNNRSINQSGMRYLSQNVSLYLYRDAYDTQGNYSMLSMKVMSNQNERVLQILHDGSLQKEWLIAPRYFTDIKLPLTLHKGLNVINLKISGGCNTTSNNFEQDVNSCWIMALQPALLKITHPFEIGDNINFADGGNSNQYITTGWSGQEPGSIWTDGNQATLNLFMDEIPDNVILDLHALAFTGPGLNNQTLFLSINNKDLPDPIVLDGVMRSVTVPIAPGYLERGSNEITLHLPNATSPKSLGLYDDPRQLGVAVSSISFKSIDQ
jgi:hypothetical protein